MGLVLKDDYTLITRHPIVLLHDIVKSLFFIIASGLILLVVSQYRAILSTDTVLYILFPIALLLVNYAFMKLILSIINYYNKLIIIVPDKLIIIDSSLVMKEDIEIVDLSKVVKVDVECHGIFAVIFGYGHLIIEQSRNEVRTLHFVSKPYDILHIIKEETNYVRKA